MMSLVVEFLGMGYLDDDTPMAVQCPFCGAAPGSRCLTVATGQFVKDSHGYGPSNSHASRGTEARKQGWVWNPITKQSER